MGQLSATAAAIKGKIEGAAAGEYGQVRAAPAAPAAPHVSSHTRICPAPGPQLRRLAKAPSRRVARSLKQAAHAKRLDFSLSVLRGTAAVSSRSATVGRFLFFALVRLVGAAAGGSIRRSVIFVGLMLTSVQCVHWALDGVPAPPFWTASKDIASHSCRRHACAASHAACASLDLCICPFFLRPIRGFFLTMIPVGKAEVAALGVSKRDFQKG